MAGFQDMGEYSSPSKGGGAPIANIFNPLEHDDSSTIKRSRDSWEARKRDKYEKYLPFPLPFCGAKALKQKEICALSVHELDNAPKRKSNTPENIILSLWCVLETEAVWACGHKVVLG